MQEIGVPVFAKGTCLVGPGTARRPRHDASSRRVLAESVVSRLTAAWNR